MKKLSLFFMFLALLGFTSCHDDKDTEMPKKETEEEIPQAPESFDKVTEEVEGGSVTYKYKDGVVVITDANKKNLKKVESDTILFFSKSAADAYKLAKGSIITSALINEVTPYGLGNRVLSVENIGDEVRCVTTHAALDEIFEMLDLKANIDLVKDTISRIVTDADGDVVEISTEKNASTKADNDTGKMLLFKYDKSYNHLYANGQLRIGATATIDIDLEKGESECSLYVSAWNSGNIGAEASCEVEIPVLPEITLFEGAVAVGPVVLRPFVSSELKLSGTIEGRVNAEHSKQFAGKFGLKNGQTFSENHTKENENVIKEITVDAKGGAFFVTLLNFGTGFYTKNVTAGVTAALSAGFTTDFRLSYADLFKIKPNLDFKVIAGASAFLKAEFFGVKFMEKEATIASKEFYKKSFPLLPTYVKKSLVVNERKGESQLIYDAAYKIKNGILNNGMDIIPALRVYKDDKQICEIIDYQHDLNTFTADTECRFEIKDLEPNVTYVAKPSLRIAGLYYYDEDGITFPKIAPNILVANNDTLEISNAVLIYEREWINDNEYRLTDRIHEIRLKTATRANIEIKFSSNPQYISENMTCDHVELEWRDGSKIVEDGPYPVSVKVIEPKNNTTKANNSIMSTQEYEIVLPELEGNNRGEGPKVKFSAHYKGKVELVN